MSSILLIIGVTILCFAVAAGVMLERIREDDPVNYETWTTWMDRAYFVATAGLACIAIHFVGVVVVALWALLR